MTLNCATVRVRGRAAKRYESVYTCEWHDAKGYWFDPPTVSIRGGRTVVSLPPAIAAETEDGAADVATVSLPWTYNVEERLKSPLAAVYRGYIDRTLQRLKNGDGPTIAALILVRNLRHDIPPKRPSQPSRASCCHIANGDAS